MRCVSFLLSVVVLVSCVRAPEASFLIKADKAPEQRELPPTPEQDNKHEDGSPAPTDDWVEAYEPQHCLDSQGRVLPTAPRPCPDGVLRPGILISEGRAFRMARTAIRYRELRTIIESDRQVWTVQRELYETQLRRADEHIKALAPTWWERNAFTIGAVGGFILGALVVTGVAVGVAAVP